MHGLDAEHADCDRARQVVEWMEHGVFDALKKQYLEKLVLLVSHDEKATDLIEAWIISVDWLTNDAGEEEVQVTLSQGKTKSKEVARTTVRGALTKSAVRDKCQVILRRLNCMVQCLPEIPEDFHMGLQLHYRDNAIVPSDYAPTGFSPTSMHDLNFRDRPINLAVGSELNTGHHSFRLHVVTKSSIEGFEDFQPSASAKCIGRNEGIGRNGELWSMGVREGSAASDANGKRKQYEEVVIAPEVDLEDSPQHRALFAEALRALQQLGPDAHINAPTLSARIGSSHDLAEAFLEKLECMGAVSDRLEDGRRARRTLKFDYNQYYNEWHGEVTDAVHGASDTEHVFSDGVSGHGPEKKARSAMPGRPASPPTARVASRHHQPYVDAEPTPVSPSERRASQTTMLSKRGIYD